MKQLGISVERFLRDTDYYTLKRVLDGTTLCVHPNTLTNILDLWLDDNFSPPEAEARKKLLEVSNGAAAPAQAAQFPSDLRTVERLVTRAARYSQDLFVLSDTVDRGSFFDPDRYASIHNKLRAVGSRGKILSYGPIQPITCAAMFHDIGEADRVKHHAFAAFLDYYFDYLRTDDRDCDYDLPFREWLENHLTIRSDREELLSWLRRYADIAHRDVREGDLSSWIERAIAVVYESGDPPPQDIEDALRALLWSREKFFEEMLLLAGVDVRRTGSEAPPNAIWIARLGRPRRRGDPSDSAAYSFLRTHPKDPQLRGWTLSTTIISGKQPQQMMIEILKSTFDSYWEGTEAQSVPARFAASRA